MNINLYLRETDADRGVKIGEIDPVADDLDALVQKVWNYGVGGEVTYADGQFVADERGSGFEICYSTDEADRPATLSLSGE